MINNLIGSVLILALAALTAGCFCRTGSACDMSSGTPETRVQAIFDRACVSCHSGSAPQGLLDLSPMGRVAMINQPSRLCPTAPALVTPGNPEQSFVFLKVTQDRPECGDRMPQAMAVLSATDIEALRVWIASLGDGGVVPVTDTSEMDATQMDSAGCPAGQAMCGGSCIDVQTDPSNCGSCGRACGTGQTCGSGACVCNGGLTLCSDRCVDTQSAAANCGACANTCGAGTVCSSGSCITGSCPTGTMNCGGSCVDTQNSLTNCGTCGTTCASGQACTSGRCACTGGATLCAGVCLNTATDSRNCGTCGRVCPTGSTCSGGNCGCSGGLTLCGSTCLDAQTNRMNCGTCGNVCAAGSTCTAGACASCGASVSFGSQVQPIFTRTCTAMGCHTGARPAAQMSLVAGTAYAQLVGRAASQCSGGTRIRVTAGDVSASYLMNKLTGIGMCFGSRMPGGSNPNLGASDMDLLTRWICNGAMNN